MGKFFPTTALSTGSKKDITWNAAKDLNSRKKSDRKGATTRIVLCGHALVRATGLEPAHLAAQEPKSCVSANFTTPAYEIEKWKIIIPSHA